MFKIGVLTVDGNQFTFEIGAFNAKDGMLTLYDENQHWMCSFPLTAIVMWFKKDE